MSAIEKFHCIKIPTLSTFKIFGRARDHGKKFPNLSKTSISGVLDN